MWWNWKIVVIFVANITNNDLKIKERGFFINACHSLVY